MSAGILLTQERIRKALTDKGYTMTDTRYRGHTAVYRYWQTPWGHIFSAPDEDHKCPSWTFDEIIKNVEKTKPP
jgi:hypothetical protein